MSTTSSDFNHEKFREAIERAKEKLRENYGVLEKGTDGDNQNVVCWGSVRNAVRRGSAVGSSRIGRNQRTANVHRNADELRNNILSHQVGGGEQGEDSQKRTKPD